MKNYYDLKVEEYDREINKPRDSDDYEKKEAEREKSVEKWLKRRAELSAESQNKGEGENENR